VQVAPECVLNALTPEEIVRVLAEVPEWVLEHLRLKACELRRREECIGSQCSHGEGKKGASLMEQCSATKRNGEPCTLPVNGPHGLCWAHDPRTPRDAAERLLEPVGPRLAATGGGSWPSCCASRRR
jgi:hypothetical protein